LPASGGTAVINGLDMRRDMVKIRKSLGLCPQHDVLFDTMTVREHLVFFAKVQNTRWIFSSDKIYQTSTPVIPTGVYSPHADTKPAVANQTQRRQRRVCHTWLATVQCVINIFHFGPWVANPCTKVHQNMRRPAT